MLQETVDDYIAALSPQENERARANMNTVMAYRSDLRQLCHYLYEQGVEHWSQVTREQLANYLIVMREGQSYRPTTIARKLAAFKSFFRYLRKEAHIEGCPVEELEAPHIPKDPPNILTVEQINSLFERVAVGTVVGQRDLAMLHMLYATGMRVSELVSLQLNAFDEEQAMIVCPSRNAQTRRERTLPLPPLVIETTMQYLTKARPRLARHPEEQALFLNHHGECLTRQGFWLIIKGYARQAGISEITPHMLRHSFAILMLKGGMELRSVQELLGHAHISTMQVYNQMAHAQARDR
ncbi:MAG: tyrosine recombinase [Ktedonobacteraceae bacterium]